MNTIAIITPDADVNDITGPGMTVLDGMIAAQTALGQITWTELTPTTARGTFVAEGRLVVSADELSRIAVVDTDNADAREAITLALWVAERH